MIAFDDFHDKGPKTLLNGALLKANQSAEKDLDEALDNIFNHPNVGPFISKLLIQHFVTSNPTPAYVERVARIFNNNGQGVRGSVFGKTRNFQTCVQKHCNPHPNRS